MNYVRRCVLCVIMISLASCGGGGSNSGGHVTTTSETPSTSPSISGQSPGATSPASGPPPAGSPPIATGLPTDLGCASNFFSDSATGDVVADWTTRLGCSDNYTQPVGSTSVHIVIQPSANLWALSDVTKQVGVSGSAINLTAGTIDNYGYLTTVVSNAFPYACAGLSPSGPVVQPTGTGDIVVNNYGTLGENYNSECGTDMIFPTTLYKSPHTITLNNYGAIWAVNGTQGFIDGLSGNAPGTAATINNYSGGRIGTSTGSALNQGNSNNYRNAGMFVTASWSWCEHGNAGWFFNNWGYCIGAEEGIYEESAGTQPKIALYGGPLIPSAHDLNGNLIFGGTVSAYVMNGQWANASLCVADLPLALASHAPILISNNTNESDPFARVDLYNTVYSYTDPTDGSAKTVNYLPLLYSYPIEGSGAHITLHYDQLYNDEAAQLLADVANGNSAAAAGTFFQYYNGATNVFVKPASWASKGKSTDAGYAFSWCNTAPVVTAFTNTQKTNSPPPQVYYVANSNGTRQYFVDPTSSNGNAGYLVNPTTVRLTGNVVQPAGTLYVGPGWTLAVGAEIATTAPLNLPNLVGSSLSSAQLISTYGLGSSGAVAANNNNTPGAFTLNPTGTINLQSATGTTIDNVDNQTAPVSETLYGSLVIDNFVDSSGTHAVSLPNVIGGGHLIQSGNSTTTLVGTANNLTGAIYIYDGTVVIDAAAGFKTPPSFVFGQNDGNIGPHYPLLDLSHVQAASFAVGSASMSGPQMEVANVGSGTGLIYPTIRLGSTYLAFTSPSTNDLDLVLTGTGGIRIGAGASLALGYFAYDNAGSGEKSVPLSTFSGGTTVEPGATLKINSRGALGFGDLTNAGLVELNGGRQYLTTWLNDKTPLPDSPPGVLPIGAQLVDSTNPLANTYGNHTVHVKGNYAQASTGNITLRVRQDDLNASNIGSGAGIQYETIVVDGKASLDGTLTIRLMSGYQLPPGGAVFAIVQSGSGIVGKFSRVQTTSDGVNFTARPQSLQQVTNVAQPVGGGATSTLLVTLR